MPVKGIAAVKRGYRIRVDKVTGHMSERAVYNVLQAGAAYSDMLTPVDTSNLINSRYAPQIQRSEGKVSGSVGYTAEYAAAVHNMSGKLKGQPREDFGMTSNHSEFGPKQRVAFGGGTGKGTYWSPDAEPKFLEKGFEMVKPDIPAILKASYE